jgi:hypothetical protein
MEPRSAGVGRLALQTRLARLDSKRRRFDEELYGDELPQSRG